MAFSKQISEPSATFLNLPLEIRRKIYKHALGGHLILPRPQEPKLPSPEAQELLGYLFSKIQPSNTNTPFNNIADLKARFKAIVRAAIYGQHWVELSTDNATSRRNLAALLLVNKQIHDEAGEALYSTNIFDINLIAESYSTNAPAKQTSSGNSNTAANSQIYQTQPKVPIKYLKFIRALHLSTRPLSTTTTSLKNTPDPILAKIKHVLVTCCSTTHMHTPSAEVRHHIPHGREWIDMWTAVAQKFTHAVSLNVDVCGWRVPPGWRREVLAPIVEAARALGSVTVERKRKAEKNDVELIDGAIAVDPVPSKLGESTKSKSKLENFTVTVPWTEKMVEGHVMAQDLGFELRTNQEAITELAHRKATDGGNTEDGWQD